MKKLLLITVAVNFINLNASFVHAQSPSQNIINLGTKSRKADYLYLSAPDSMGVRKRLKTPSANNDRTQNTKLPYPIIFIHGLCSNSATWDTLTNFLDVQYGLNFGGRFDFCLNSDNDNTVANKNFFPTAGADITLFTPLLTAADYYTVNFDVGIDGGVFPATSDGNYVTSNQQAIIKQGAALSRAIHDVLQITGREKVILMGHSMGGLASREYIQNSYNWQADGHHHVAKLATTGTPHGGSNASAIELLDSWADIDDQSDAVRDLRTSYYVSDAPGVYLFGGLEDNSIIDDMTFDNFYNVDVNCSSTPGNTIIGLNQKNIDTTLDYSCIIGICDCTFSSPGDGVVSDSSADINNVYPGLTTNLFYYNGSATTEIHSDLPGLTYENMQDLDEPNIHRLGYHIGFDTAYTGFTTVQPAGGNSYDYDNFKFAVPAGSNVTVSINNIALADLMVHIVDIAGNTVGSVVHSSGASSINYTQAVTAGNYYLEIYGTPTITSYLNPYSFILTNAMTTGIEASNKADDLVIYPNPANNVLNITNISSKTQIKLYDVLGKLVFETEAEGSTSIDTSLLNGVYTLSAISSAKGTVVTKVVVTK